MTLANQPHDAALTHFSSETAGMSSWQASETGRRGWQACVNWPQASSIDYAAIVSLLANETQSKSGVIPAMEAIGCQ